MGHPNSPEEKDECLSRGRNRMVKHGESHPFGENACYASPNPPYAKSN